MPTLFSRAITQCGLVKSGTQPLKKGNGAGGGGNQTKETFYFLPRTRRGREKKNPIPQPFVYLAWRDGCLGSRAQLSQGGDHSSAIPFHRDAAREALRLRLALPWLPAPARSSSEPAAPGEETSTLPS